MVYKIGLIVPIPIWALLIVQVLSGMFFYFGLSIVLRIDSFAYILNTIKNLFKKNRNKVA